MSLLVESIWINKNKLINLPYHQARFNLSFRNLFGSNPKIDLRTLLDAHHLNNDDVKCRVVYDKENILVEYEPYDRKTISTARLVYDDNVEYKFKYVNRPVLDDIFRQRKDCHEVIIVKNGYITDAFYYNIIIKKNNQFYTPANPLLKGVMRQYYLDKGAVLPLDITVDELYESSGIYLVNALNPIEYITIKDIVS